MTTTDAVLRPHQLAVLVLEATVLAAWVGVAALMAKRGINGPCRLCLGMLATWRVSVVWTLDWGDPGWGYLWGVLFAHCFLYAVHHLGATLHCLRARLRARTTCSVATVCPAAAGSHPLPLSGGNPDAARPLASAASRGGLRA